MSLIGRIVIAALVSFGIVCAIWLAAWSIFASLTCDRELKSAQVVGAGPQENLTLRDDMSSLPDEIDLGIFHSNRLIGADGRCIDGGYEYPRTSDQPDYSYVDVDLTLLVTTQAAERSFVTHCEDRTSLNDLEDFEYGRTQNGQFCISYTREARADLAGLCNPLGYYYSFVVIRNENLFIWDL